MTGRTKSLCQRQQVLSQRVWLGLCLLVTGFMGQASSVVAGPLLAGVGRSDITEPATLPANDPLYVKALVLRNGDSTAVLITVDAVAIEEIGKINSQYLPTVRAALLKQFQIRPEQVIVNASHCHGVVCDDVDQQTINAVAAALQNLVPVKVGAGVGHEDRISENRRLKLKDGRETDVRHAYALPRDEDVAEIGPIDPEIGLLRIDRLDGRPLAAVYNFAVHPIQGAPNKRNTADIPAFASRVIEDNLGEGALAFFVQGCAGDINPVTYKDVHNPRDAEPLGMRLGLSAMRGLKAIQTIENADLNVKQDLLSLPRSADLEHRIAAAEAERVRLMESLAGTSLNFKTFLPLYVQYKVAGDFPAYSSHRYLRDKALGRDDLLQLDTENQANMQSYLRNIQIMEELSRVQVNLKLLQKHHAQTVAAARPTLDVEVMGLKVGNFVMVTFPGELTVEIGLEIKRRAAQEFTFVAGYTNGYIYYTPTESQRNNTGYAQEDCDCLVAPEWRKLFDERVAALLKKL